MLAQMLSFSRTGHRSVFLTAAPDGRDRSRGSARHNRRGLEYTREQHWRGGISRRHQHNRVDAADVQKISSEVFRAGAQSKSVCGHYLLHRSVIVIHAQLSRMIYMCMFFTLIILYLEVCVQTFQERDDGNGEGMEGGRDTAGSRGSRMVCIYIRKSYYIMYST